MPCARSPGRLWGGAVCLWILSTELASCHHSGAYNFEVSPVFFFFGWEKFVTLFFFNINAGNLRGVTRFKIRPLYPCGKKCR